MSYQKTLKQYQYKIIVFYLVECILQTQVLNTLLIENQKEYVIANL